MEQLRFYLPKYTPIYKSGSKLCIGYPNKSNSYCEFDYTEKLSNMVVELLEEGKFQDNFGSFEMELLGNKLLSNDIPTDFTHRGELFLKYIDNIVIDKETKNCSILIFGAGAVGSNLLYLLAQFGFNNITIVDFDIVSESDVLKISIYDKKDIGRFKIEALHEKISANFGIDIRYFNKRDDSESFFKEMILEIKPEFIIKACDPNLIFRTNLNSVAVKNNIPCFHAAYSFEKLRIGPLYIPNYLGCDECLDLINQDYYGRHYAFREHEQLFYSLKIHPSVSFNINILCSLALKEILFFLTGNVKYCFSIGRLIEFNPLDLTYVAFEVEKHPLCTICK